MNNETLNMTFTGIMDQNKKKVVYVRFERTVDGKLEFAEGVLPEGTIEKSLGFTMEECAALEFYLKENSEDIFRQAKNVSSNIFGF